jgi:AAHS family benzoate transporter-like MFS transporter
MTTLAEQTSAQSALRSRTIAWVVGLGFAGLVFDGFDLVVYGAVLPGFLKDPSQIGPVSDQLGGALGSYALFGVFVGALVAGSISDHIGRRRLMLVAYAWFSLAMGFTALTHTTAMFGLGRVLAGLGIGTLLATTAALVSEVAPPGKKNLYNALAYSGIAFGSTLSALLSIFLLDSLGWRGLFGIGALPLVTLLPLAVWKLPESVAWLLSRGRRNQAEALSQRTGIPLDEVPVTSLGDERRDRIGFPGLFSGGNALPAIVLGFTSAVCLLLVYSLNTWLPALLGRAGFSTKGSLTFLFVLNGAAVVGQLFGSRLADRFGPRRVVATFFAVAAVGLVLLTLGFPVGVLLVLVAFVGIGTSGNQSLIYGFVANYFRVNVRGAATAWCAGFGRLGGIVGPTLVGFLVAAKIGLGTIYYILAAIAVVGVAFALLVPRRREDKDAATRSIGTEPQVVESVPPRR